MLKTLEKVIKRKIEMYEAFIESRIAFNMPIEEYKHKKEECEHWLITIQEAIKGYDFTK